MSPIFRNPNKKPTLHIQTNTSGKFLPPIGTSEFRQPSSTEKLNIRLTFLTFFNSTLPFPIYFQSFIGRYITQGFLWFRDAPPRIEIIETAIPNRTVKRPDVNEN